MAGIEELLRRRQELLQEIDNQIRDGYARPVTLMFTDIVGSTEIFETAGDIAGRQMIQTHNDLLFPIIADHGGSIIKTIGDSIMASFAEPAKGVACAMRLQEALVSHNELQDPQSRIRVRMGLHYGKAVMEEKDLFGDMVNTAARVESKADGEEILISGGLQEELRQGGFPLVFLGSEPVKGKKQQIDFYLVNWNRREEQEVLETWQRRKGAAHTQGKPAASPSAPAGPSAAGGAPAADGPCAAASQGRAESPVPGSLARTGSPAVQRRRVRLGALPDLEQQAAGQTPATLRGNPYLNRVMIPRPELFFGRQGIVKRIASRIGAQRPQSISLVGERRMGKSSLLSYLFAPRTRLSLFEAADRYLFLFADFQSLRTVDEARFFELIYASLRKQLGAAVELDLEPDQDGMRRLCEAVAEAGHRFILLFDEFEAVTKNERMGPEFYAFLRSLANNFPLAFVTASGRNLKDMCVTHEISDSPFFNIFALLHLGLFGRAEALELIREPSQASGRPLEALSERILAMGGLYPFFLQIASSAWYEYLDGENLSAEKIQEIPRDVLATFREEAAPHFEYVLETLPEEEREALRAVLEGRPPEAAPAEVLERKGYLFAPSEGALEPFSEEFGRFAGRFLRVDREGDPKVDRKVNPKSAGSAR
jgi:class 3 adenylate cyclase